MAEKKFRYPERVKECPMCGSNKVKDIRSNESYLNKTWDTFHECNSCFKKW